MVQMRSSVEVVNDKNAEYWCMKDMEDGCFHFLNITRTKDYF